MKRIILWGVSVGMFLGCLCISRPAWSQQTTAAITGTVVDEGGAAISGATVTVTDTDRGTVYTAKTDESGTYNFVARSDRKLPGEDRGARLPVGVCSPVSPWC